MTRARLGGLLLVIACSKESAPADHHEHAHEPEERHAAPATGAGEQPTETGAGAPSVRIDPGMLRDLRITTQAAEARSAGEHVTVLGELRVNEDAYAEVSSPIPARVSRVLAAPGDLVHAQQALAELSSPEVGKARAVLRTAEAERTLARLAFERRQQLAKDQIVSERELEMARAELARAEAEAAAAQQTLEALGAAAGRGASFAITSPLAGTVIERTALLGRLADPSQPLFVVGDLARLWLVVHAFERDALRMHTRTPARVTFPALPGQVASGTVTRIGTRVDPMSRTVDVRIEIDNPSGLLRPGMSASALVRLGDSADMVVAVPVEALQRSPEGWCVFLPTSEPGVFLIRSVARGRDLGGEVEVLRGLRAGEIVVKDGAFLLAAEADKARGDGADHHH